MSDVTTVEAICLRCGYDLRGMTVVAVCPECGLAVARSVGDRERLEECPPGWVRRVSIGVGLLAVTAVWMVVGQAATQAMYGWTRVVPAPLGFPLTADTLARGSALSVQLVAVWLVTSREPGARRERPFRVWLWRTCTLIGLASVALDAYLVSAGLVLRWPGLFMANVWWRTPGTWLAVVSSLMAGFYTLAPVVGFWHLKWLAARIGRPKLAEYAGIVGAGLSALMLMGVVREFQQSVNGYRTTNDGMLTGVAVAAALLIVVYAVRRSLGRHPRGRGYVWTAALWAAAWCWGVALVGTDYTRRLWKTVLVVGIPMTTAIVFYAWGLFLLARMAVKFWRAAREAEDRWRRADAAAASDVPAPVNPAAS